MGHDEFERLSNLVRQIFTAFKISVIHALCVGLTLQTFLLPPTPKSGFADIKGPPPRTNIVALKALDLLTATDA